MLASLLNFRDVGGVGTRDGRYVRRCLVFRSDGLTALTEDDRDRMRDEFGLRTIVDLRSGLEHERLGRYDARWLRASVHELPVLDGAVLRDRVASGAFDMTEMYRAIVVDGAPAVRTALGVLAEPGALPAVVTCSGGKDRTGIVVAVLLAALGVARDAIVADYERSAGAVDALRERVTSRLEGDGVVVPQHSFAVDVDAFVAALDTVGAERDAVDAYLGSDLGARLRRAMLEP